MGGAEGMHLLAQANNIQKIGFLPMRLMSRGFGGIPIQI
jgi:hypothetical protein